jgi:HK97 family phage major capsid protein
MEIQDFLVETGLVPLATLTALATARGGAGDDVVSAFTRQIERRSAAAEALLTAARAAERELLASENRDVDRLMWERDKVLPLLRHVQQQTDVAYHVPLSQAPETRTTEPAPATLTREQPMGQWLQRRGAYAYQGERGVDALRFGAIVRAYALNNRTGLSELERRVLAEGAGSTGGFTVPEVLGAQFLDRVRNAMAVQRAGATIVPMSSETLHLARLAQPGATPGPQWKLENADIVESSLALERVTLNAKVLTTIIKLSVELSEDSTNIDSVIEHELSQKFALELDRVALMGSGINPEPLGILGQPGVTVRSNGGVRPHNYDFVVAAITEVWARNHNPTARLYNADLARLMAFIKAPSWAGDEDGPTMPEPPIVAAVPPYRTNQIPSDSSPLVTSLYVGDFSQLLIGMRTSFTLEVSRQAADAFTKMQIWVRAYLRADIALAHPEAFCVTTGLGVSYITP